MIRFSGEQPEFSKRRRLEAIVASAMSEIEKQEKNKNKLELDINDIIQQIMASESDAERRSLAEEAIRTTKGFVASVEAFLGFLRKTVDDFRKLSIDTKEIEDIIPDVEKEREEKLKIIKTLEKMLALGN
ncbi:hypothetical protein HYZ82_02770 [Candidatus Nomurabacteria bacterium]|nr:hypothetical protein [Candidatus Nomurabacteria bacterium]